jgi:hypothetical protein
MGVVAAAEVGADARADAVDRVHVLSRHVAEVVVDVAVIAAVAVAEPEDTVRRPATVVEGAVEVVIETVAVGQGDGAGVNADASGGITVVLAAPERDGRRWRRR